MNLSEIFAQYLPKDAVPPTTARGRSGFNSLGYQCAEFDQRGAINLLVIGCSWTQGPADGTHFSRYTCEQLEQLLGVSVGDWNFGIGGNSADYMARTLMCSLDALKPTAVFMLFPGPDRHEYLRADGKLIRYQIDWIDEERGNGPHWRQLDLIDREMIRHLNPLHSPFHDAMNVLKNFKFIECMLNARRIPWGFSLVPHPELEEMFNYFLDAGWVDGARYLGHPWKTVDTVTETDSHPGPKSRQQFGSEVFKWFASNYMGDLRNAAHAVGGVR